MKQTETPKPACYVIKRIIRWSHDCYKVLSVAKEAGADDIKAAFNHFAHDIHRPLPRPGMAHRFAYHILPYSAAILLDPKLRKTYDACDAESKQLLFSLFNLTDEIVMAKLIRHHDLVRVENANATGKLHLFDASRIGNRHFDSFT